MTKNMSGSDTIHKNYILFSKLCILTALALLLLPFSLRAENNATIASTAVSKPGPATLVAGESTITVRIAYTGDDNGDNSALIEWGEDGVDFANSTNLGHNASPYLYEIPSLDYDKTYQVRITISDADDGSTNLVQTLTGLKPFNTLVHNSISTGSDKWTADEGWGLATASSQYGEFTCRTCHDSSTDNIKRVKKTITAPSDAFPGGEVDFQSADNDNSDFGDDSDNHTSSTHVCEVCHTKTNYHHYDTSTQTGDTNHYNNKDCVSCHQHRSAFKASCAACHGGGSTGSAGANYWPDGSSTDPANDVPGRHRAHMDALALANWGYNATVLLNQSDHHDKQIDLCGYCHATPGGDADHADYSVTIDADNDFHPMWNKATADDGTVDGSGNCTSIACHNNKATGSGTYGWLDAGTMACVMCHTAGGNNSLTEANPVSGLHVLTAANTFAHDDNFDDGGSTFGCEDCHIKANISDHLDGIAKNADYTGAEVGLDTATMYNDNGTTDASRGTCQGTDSLSGCHSDGGNWARLWSTDANTDIVASPNPGQPVCNVCHGQFSSWVDGTSHAGTYDGAASTRGDTHNRGSSTETGCTDCHNYLYYVEEGYNYAVQHRNDFITMNDDSNSTDVTVDTLGVRCNTCHTQDEDPATENTKTYVQSDFPLEQIAAAPSPDGTCFGGLAGCHGDAAERWWPVTDSNHPDDYPNRAGAHIAHNLTLGTLIAEARGGTGTTPTDADFDATCRFCHPMVWQGSTWASIKHKNGVTELYGGYKFPTANADGTIASGDPETDSWTGYDVDATDGYLYQLDDPENPGSLYPLDKDATYRQYLYDYRGNSALNHGTCSQIACHSNTPHTPQWYGDEQAPGLVTDLAGYTHNQDATTHDITEYDDPGTVHLYWTAPGDNGDLDGTAYEYEIYYSDAGAITDANLSSATRAGGAPSVLRYGEQQEMVVDGLTVDTPYYFAVVTKDQPQYKDEDDDDILETFIADSNRSLVKATGPVTAHTDDVAPTFWGINEPESHDTGDAVNLSWDAARDHTLPITYQVYWSDYSLKTHLAYGGTMPTLTKPSQYDGEVYSFSYTAGTSTSDPPTLGGSDYTIYASTTRGLAYQVSGLDTGVLYNFMVRAEDGHDPVGDGTGIGNIDDNTVVAMAMANNMPQETKSTALYLVSGSTGMVYQEDPAAPVWTDVSTGGGTGSFTLRATTELDDDLIGTGAERAVWMNGISFDLYVTNGDKRNPHDFDLEIGFNDGSVDTVLGSQTVAVGRRASRVVKIGLSNISGEVDANSKLYIKLTNTSGSLTLAWGDATKKGQLMVTAQPINHQPSAPVLGSLSRAVGGYINITWTTSNDGTPSDGGQTLHYDILGSSDNGTTWPYVIGTNLTDADAVTGVLWDTVGDGLDRLNGTGNFSCKVRVDASDGYRYETVPGGGEWNSHNATTSGTITLDNSQDDEPPAAVTISHVEPRPKQGAAYLHWIAVGNDGYNHGTRAAYYDIRFRKTADGDLESNWDDADTVSAEGEPVPGFSGTAQEFELLNVTPDTSHSVAIVTCDAGEDDVANTADDNCSGLSNVYTFTSGQYACGICHSTPPDEPDTKGKHRHHGYTLEDCAKCHGDGTNPDGNDVTQYNGRHYDGVINIGWSKDADGNHLTLAEITHENTNSISIDQGLGVIYSDPDGAGGYNSNGTYTSTANTDSGRCMNFIGANANGCHGPFSPQWAPDTDEPSPDEPTCSDCHGDKSTDRDLDPYDRIWDCNVDGAPSELVKASPPTANHGGTTTSDRYVGAHERHLNASFRFAKGDSCRLCHKDTMDLGLHADGNVDVLFDAVADQDDVSAAIVDQTHGTVDTVGASCGSLNNTYCHDTSANWAEPGAKCNGCHGMDGKTYDVDANTSTISHVSSSPGTVVECTYCHVAGHPQSPDGLTSGDPEALLISNNAAVGINYRSGGIHLRSDYPWGTYTTLAEICWGCHDQESVSISEWGTNTSEATGSSGYNFGTLNQSAWTGAIWTSGKTEFAYKTGYIQSTHTADSTGTSKVTWDSANGRYNETTDPISKIRCSNCHDVHDNNLAPGDTMTGRPYLRGTWKSNPYEEDGAPWSKVYADKDTKLNGVPRGSTAYNELGGYFIDQNNVSPGTTTSAVYPTSGWTVESSAGLCILCHGDNVDDMDQRDDVADGNTLWLGDNGHSNSALGGTFSAAANIFDYSHGRPTAVLIDYTGSTIASQTWANMVPDMGLVTQNADSLIGAGTRSPETAGYTPTVDYRGYAFNQYNWGATVDAGTTDQMYHQFSCSKCHNPHASRLPKLMITNCLDIRHNTWDDAKSSVQAGAYSATALNPVERGMPAAYYAAAVNCHRFDPARGDADNNNTYETKTLRGGWNKVTPWVKDNLYNVEHKGSKDPAYGTSNATTPWRHSDFPTETTGW